MKSTLRATQMQKLRHRKGWRLVQLHEALKENDTPISWPILVNIDRGYKIKIVRDKNKKIVERIKLPYKPGRGFLTDLGKLLDAPANKIYQDRSKS